MNIFTTRSINIITLFVTVLVFLFINLAMSFFSKVDLSSVKFHKELKEENTIQYEVKISEQNQTKYNWYIQIDSIDLRAPIEETTDVDVLSRAVGHFEETSLSDGNIGLAAHNRGYELNYFENLKLVKIGDEVVYHYNDFNMTYIIDTIEIIKDTDWSYLEETEENRITLITCVENEPDYRRCVQAIEKQ